MNLSKLQLAAIVILFLCGGYCLGYSMGIDWALSWGVEQVERFTDIDTKSINMLIAQYGMVKLDTIYDGLFNLTG